MEITIQGLSDLQRELADQIWQCESQEAVQAFIAQLPKRLRAHAELVRELMIAAAIDQEMEVSDVVRDYLQGR
jgi:anaerobic glycerol-3-phosphate dehydrogenase